MEKVKSPSWFMVVVIILLIWDLLGIMSFVMQTMMKDQMMAAMSDEEREIFLNTPFWHTIVYFVAVVSATLGSIGLIMKRKWAKPLFIISLISVIVQMSFSLFVLGYLELKGFNAAIFPIILVIIGAYQVVLADKATKKGWIV